MRRRYPLDPTLAQSLTERRTAVALSQNAVALAVGVSESTIAKIETLRVPVSPERHAAIESVLAQAEREGTQRPRAETVV